MPGAAESEPRDAARALVGYVAGAPAPPGTCERHAAACAALLPDAASKEDAAVVSFAVRHPWSIGPLDAAVALLAPRARLRSMILIAAAVTEATPEAGAAFMPRAVSRARLAWLLLRCGAVSAAWLVAGIPLLLALKAMARLRA